MSYKQPPRTPIDGPISVGRSGPDINIHATHSGIEQSIVVTEYNAARIFASLSLILGIPLPSSVGKAIMMT